MTRFVRTSLAVCAVTLAAPLISFAQSTCVQVGDQIYCGMVVNNVPEISASASIAGVVLLMGGILMIRGRQRIQG